MLQQKTENYDSYMKTKERIEMTKALDDFYWEMSSTAKRFPSVRVGFEFKLHPQSDMTTTMDWFYENGRCQLSKQIHSELLEPFFEEIKKTVKQAYALAEFFETRH